MTDKLRSLIFDSDIPENYKYYWGYMYDLGREIIVPFLSKNLFFKSGDSVIEIGSAEGGVLHALADKGAKNCIGTDIVQSRLDMGDKITKIIGLDVNFVNNDIIYGEPPEEWRNKYDLAILRDVIEHLDDTSIALKNIRKVIRKDGFLFVTFPPYKSPYGGHQHTLSGNILSKLPFIHLLPQNIFKNLIKSGREQDIEEVVRLIDIQLSPKKFQNAVKNSGFEIVKEDYYFFRPVFKMKFGLPTIKMNFLSKIPIIQDYFTMEASFVLKAI